MAAPVTAVLAAALVALPVASGVVLAFIAPWRLGVRIAAGSAALQFVAAAALAWRVGSLESYVVALTALVAMTTSWLGWRDIPAAIAAGSLDQRGARRYHAGFQLLVGAIQAALLAGTPILTWFAAVVAVAAATLVTGAPRGISASIAASRLLLLGSVGLMIALLGTLLLASAPAAGILVLAGYGVLAGLVPLHAWLPAASADGLAPGAVAVALMAMVPLLIFTRMPLDPRWLIAFGLLSLLPGAAMLHAAMDHRRLVAVAAIAQIGIAAFAIGLGARQIAWLSIALLALARSAVLQSQCADRLAWLAFALLPLYVLCLLATQAAANSVWLLALLAAGVLLLVCGLLRRLPDSRVTEWRAAAPVWLQLAAFALLAFVLPVRVVVR